MPRLRDWYSLKPRGSVTRDKHFSQKTFFNITLLLLQISMWKVIPTKKPRTGCVVEGNQREAGETWPGALLKIELKKTLTWYWGFKNDKCSVPNSAFLVGMTNQRVTHSFLFIQSLPDTHTVYLFAPLPGMKFLLRDTSADFWSLASNPCLAAFSLYVCTVYTFL